MKTIWSLLVIFCLAGCSQDTHDFDKRLGYWQHSLKELPLGSSSDQVTRWGKSHGIELSFLPEQRQFYANVERIPVNGIKFPCSEWNIIIQITMDKAGRSIKNEVGQVGSCV